ncbi:MAG: hypothetical protein ABW185_00545 [Sedimenticola sp.]
MKSSFSSQQDNHDDMIHDINTCQSDIDTLNKKCEHLSVAVNLKQITDVIPDNNIFDRSQKSKSNAETTPKSVTHESRSPQRSPSKIKVEGKKRGKYRSESGSRSPPRPKLGIFRGDKAEKVEPFLCQFERAAGRRRWSSEHSASRLLDLLGGVALEFANRLPSHILKTYTLLSLHLTQRFSLKLNPRTARKELSTIRQVEGESIEDFSQKVSALAMDGHTTMDPHSLDELSVEAFLRGLHDKQAARHVLEKDPTNVCQGLQLVKEHQANNKAIFGTASVKTYNQRNVTFSGETNLDETLKLTLNNFLEKNFKKLSLTALNDNTEAIYQSPQNRLPSPVGSQNRPRFDSPTRPNYRSPSRPNPPSRPNYSPTRPPTTTRPNYSPTRPPTRPNYSPARSNYSPTRSNYSPTRSNYSPTRSNYSPTRSNYSPTRSNYQPTSSNYPHPTNHNPPPPSPPRFNTNRQSQGVSFTPDSYNQPKSDHKFQNPSGYVDARRQSASPERNHPPASAQTMSPPTLHLNGRELGN